MKFLRGGFFLALVFAVCGCSSITPFLIVNKGDVAVLITLDIPRPKSGSVIFSPFGFNLIPFKNDSPDYDNRVSITAKHGGDTHEVMLPAHTVLEFGHLRNEKYEKSKRQFMNGRIFNLKKLSASKTEITADNFDSFFKLTSYGVLWVLP